MLQLFVVFHDTIYDDCYENIPQEYLDKYFTFIAVNKSIPKTYTKGKYNVINEWDLPHYNSQFQDKGYKENSAIYHVHANKIHEKYEYIGFFQYDMKFNSNMIDEILKKMVVEPTCFCLEAFNYKFCSVDTLHEPDVMAYLEHSYFSHFKRNISRFTLYPLYNSYIIPNECYEKIMSWVLTLYGNVARYVKQRHYGHIAGVYERIMAFAVGELFLPMIKLDIKHDHFYKNSLSKEVSS